MGLRMTLMQSAQMGLRMLLMHSLQRVEQPETRYDQIVQAALEVLDPVGVGRGKQGAGRDLATFCGRWHIECVEVIEYSIPCLPKNIEGDSHQPRTDPCDPGNRCYTSMHLP
jgi:hypothetical protein